MFEHNVMTNKDHVRLDFNRNKKCNYCNVMMVVLGMLVADSNLIASQCKNSNVEHALGVFHGLTGSRHFPSTSN